VLTRWLVIVAIGLVACGASGSAPTPTPTKDTAMRTYKLVPRNASSGTPPITVSFAMPGGWKENLSDAMTPVFEIPGLASGSRVSLTAITLTGSPAQQMSKAIELQDLAGGQRTDLSGGRVWVQKNDGMLHARVFVPYAGGVVMGVAMLRDAGKLPEIRAAFETMTVGG
jgi:hypothetical protein